MPARLWLCLSPSADARTWSRVNFGEAPRVLRCFFQQPGSKRRNFRQFRRRLWTHDPESERRFEGEIERPNQPPGNQVAGSERCARQRNSLSIYGGIDRHARLIKDDAALDVDTIDFDPPQPVFP